MLLMAPVVQPTATVASSLAWKAQVGKLAWPMLHQFCDWQVPQLTPMAANCLALASEVPEYDHTPPPPRLRPVRMMRLVSIRKFCFAYLIISSTYKFCQ